MTKITRERSEEMAERITPVIMAVDLFISTINEDDLELLEVSLSEIKKQISYKQSALPLIHAMGGNYENTEDVMKAETLETVIHLIKVRKEARETITKEKKQKQTNQQFLRDMGIM